MINGSPTDPNAASFKSGAHSVLDASGYTIAAEFDTPDWSPDEAQAWMEGQISAVKGTLVGVYAANDGTAGGAIAALKGGGVDPLPPVTGQDSELAAIQRVLAGDQAMTIYKPIPGQAEAAAKAALALAAGEEPESTGDYQGVVSTILDPIAVTKDNVKDTIVKDEVYEVGGHLHRRLRRRLRGRRHQLTHDGGPGPAWSGPAVLAPAAPPPRCGTLRTTSHDPITGGSSG